jgi:two-component system sensor histidine kinase UhpB
MSVIDPEARTSMRSGLPFVWRLFVPNAVVLLLAGALLTFSPATISDPPHVQEALVVVLGLAAMLAVNLLIITRTVAPLSQLTRVTREVDPLQPGQRVRVESGSEEVMELSAGFNRMLERLETERRESGRRMLAAQESERRRIARELHDEVGQTVTGLMLEIGNAAGNAPEGLAAELRQVQEEARSLSDELQKIVRQLRPDALDDLGLGSALTHLGQSFSDRFGIRVRRVLATDLPDLDPETELVLYRVAQEAMTNVARHSGATAAELKLIRVGDGLRLTVRDDGTGMNGAVAGTGIRGMRERALLLDAALTIDSTEGGGTEVRLDLPLVR